MSRIGVLYESGTFDWVPFDTYPDGTFYTKWRPNKGKVITIACFTTEIEGLTKAIALRQAIAERSFTRELINLYIPFLPGARQDRANSDGDFLVTLFTVARLINNADFHKVFTVDVHSAVASEKISRLCNFEPHAYFDLAPLSHYDGIISPDKGAVNRAKGFADALGIPLYIADKERDVETGKLIRFKPPGNLEPGKNYLIVDDICDGGGTFLGLRAAIPGNIRVSLFVTHGLFTNPKAIPELGANFGTVYTLFNWGESTLPVVLGNNEFKGAV